MATAVPPTVNTDAMTQFHNGRLNMRFLRTLPALII